MPQVDIKICGLRTPDAVDAAAQAGADYMGLVLFPGSPRHVSVGEAKTLRAYAEGRLHVIAVTVDADDALLEQIVAQVQPDFLQLHGHEPPARARSVRERYGIPVIKAIGVRKSDDVAQACRFEECADLLLFDAKPPRAAPPGGSGLAFDWRLLAGHAFVLPWFLSGGLNAENVSEALRITGARMVDVSSGIESEPGIKDARLIEAFINAVRKTEAA